jgi:AcrR family transcriptional regulator
LTVDDRRVILRTMSVAPIRDRKAERRSETRAEILDASWAIAREDGLSELSLRVLGQKVGMRAQSLYSYFDSKHAIYDAMFREANEELLRRMEEITATVGTPEEQFRSGARVFVEFATEDPARAQLLFVRSLPGFEPTEEAYAPAVRVLELERDRLRDIGVDAGELLDLWTATLSGLVQQQLANDPGGDRWLRLLDDAIEMYLAYARSRIDVARSGRRTTTGPRHQEVQR